MCKLCLQEIETTEHILVQCVYARQVWWQCSSRLRVQILMPTTSDTLENWWLAVRERFRDKQRKAVDSLVTLICWSLWKQRNARVFLNIPEQVRPERLVELIGEEFHLWRLARLEEGGRHNISRE